MVSESGECWVCERDKTPDRGTLSGNAGNAARCVGNYTA
jgi:hypothetical protein